MRQVSPALKQSNVLRRCAPLRVKQSIVGRRSGSCFRRAAVDRGPVPPSVPALCLDLSLCYTVVPLVLCATGKGPRCQYSETPGTPKCIGTKQNRTAQGKPPPPGIGKTQIGPSMQNHQSKETIKLLAKLRYKSNGDLVLIKCGISVCEMRFI